MTSLSQPTNNLASFRSSELNIEVVAALDEHDFRHARASIPDFERSLDYDDWLDDRYGLTVGLCSSGVDARMVTVDLSLFLTWCRFARLALTEKNLHVFAGVVAVMRDRLRTQVEATTLATVSEAEFAAYFDLVEAFRSAGDYAHWLARRDAAVQAALASGNVVFEAPTPIGAFLEWARCLGERSSEALLDRYAALTLDALAGE
jgi:hypothetical protein